MALPVIFFFVCLASLSTTVQSSSHMHLRRRTHADYAPDNFYHALKRSRNRVDTFANIILSPSAASSSDFNSSIYAMADEFLTTLEIGTPPQNITVIVDTGSDLVWTQCKPCQSCFTQPQPLYDSTKSSSYVELPCTGNKYCTFLQTEGGGSNCSTDKKCSYGYSYGDASYTNGILATETLTLTDTSGAKKSIPNFVFGCGQDNGPNDSFANASGIVGLGRGLVSANSQLGSLIDNKFSYCLVPWDATPNVTSLLIMGNDSILTGPQTVSTPIISNKAPGGPYSTFYYIDLQGVSVGGKLLKIPNGTFDIQPDGSGGLIVDSGTTITFLEDAGYQLILAAFKAEIKLKPGASPQGLDLCYTIPKSGNYSIPPLTFHFKNADLTLSPENYFIDLEGSLCLAMASNFGFSIFGNIQQQNFQFGYDTTAQVLSLTPTTCAKL